MARVSTDAGALRLEVGDKVSDGGMAVEGWLRDALESVDRSTDDEKCDSHGLSKALAAGPCSAICGLFSRYGCYHYRPPGQCDAFDCKDALSMQRAETERSRLLGRG
jgi:hypothetical protein